MGRTRLMVEINCGFNQGQTIGETRRKLQQYLLAPQFLRRKKLPVILLTTIDSLIPTIILLYFYVY